MAADGSCLPALEWPSAFSTSEEEAAAAAGGAEAASFWLPPVRVSVRVCVSVCACACGHTAPLQPRGQCAHGTSHTAQCASTGSVEVARPLTGCFVVASCRVTLGQLPKATTTKAQQRDDDNQHRKHCDNHQDESGGRVRFLRERTRFVDGVDAWRYQDGDAC